MGVVTPQSNCFANWCQLKVISWEQRGACKSSIGDHWRALHFNCIEVQMMSFLPSCNLLGTGFHPLPSLSCRPSSAQHLLDFDSLLCPPLNVYMFCTSFCHSIWCHIYITRTPGASLNYITSVVTSLSHLVLNTYWSGPQPMTGLSSGGLGSALRSDGSSCSPLMFHFLGL